MKKLSRILVAILGATTILFGILYIKTMNSNKTYVKFSQGCATSFSTAVDYIMCSTDYRIGNVKNISTCEPFLETTMTEAKFIKDKLGYEPHYNYIGK